jgi:hypothetical protein
MRVLRKFKTSGGVVILLWSNNFSPLALSTKNKVNLYGLYKKDITVKNMSLRQRVFDIEENIVEALSLPENSISLLILEET